MRRAERTVGWFRSELLLVLPGPVAFLIVFALLGGEPWSPVTGWLLFAIVPVAFLLALVFAPRLHITTNRLVIDRPLLTWLLGRPCESASYRFSDIRRIELNRHDRLVLTLWNHDQVTFGPCLGAEGERVLAQTHTGMALWPTPQVTFRPLKRLCATRSASTLRCPFCRDDIGFEASTHCSSCRTRYHAECFEELGACATLGCATPSLRRAA